MKPVVGLTLTAAILGSVVSQHGGDHDGHGDGTILSCDTSNLGLLEALLDGDAVGVVHPEGDHGHGDEHDHDHDHEEGEHDHDEGRRLQHDHDDHDHDEDHDHDASKYPEVEFLGCNHTHFDVIFNNHIFTYENEIYVFESDCEFVNHTESSFARHEEGNCYFVRCSEGGHDHGDEHGEGEHDHDHDHDHDEGRMLFPVPRALQHDHDHDDHDHEGLDVDANRAFYLEGHTLYTAHAPLCCDQVTPETDPHHTCGFNEFLLELFEEEEPEDEGDPTIAIAIGAVTAFALLLVVVAWFSPSGEKKQEEAVDAKVEEVEVKAPIEVAEPVAETDAEAEEVKASV